MVQASSRHSTEIFAHCTYKPPSPRCTYPSRTVAPWHTLVVTQECPGHSWLQGSGWLCKGLWGRRQASIHRSNDWASSIWNKHQVSGVIPSSLCQSHCRPRPERLDNHTGGGIWVTQDPVLTSTVADDGLTIVVQVRPEASTQHIHRQCIQVQKWWWIGWNNVLLSSQSDQKKDRQTNGLTVPTTYEALRCPIIVVVEPGGESIAEMHIIVEVAISPEQIIRTSILSERYVVSINRIWYWHDAHLDCLLQFSDQSDCVAPISHDWYQIIHFVLG